MANFFEQFDTQNPVDQETPATAKPNFFAQYDQSADKPKANFFSQFDNPAEAKPGLLSSAFKGAKDLASEGLSELKTGAESIGKTFMGGFNEPSYDPLKKIGRGVSDVLLSPDVQEGLVGSYGAEGGGGALAAQEAQAARGALSKIPGKADIPFNKPFVPEKPSLETGVTAPTRPPSATMVAPTKTPPSAALPGPPVAPPSGANPQRAAIEAFDTQRRAEGKSTISAVNNLPPGTIKDPNQLTPIPPRPLGAASNPLTEQQREAEAVSSYSRDLFDQRKAGQVYTREALEEVQAANQGYLNADPAAHAEAYAKLSRKDTHSLTPEEIELNEKFVKPGMEEIQQLYKEAKIRSLKLGTDPEETGLMAEFDPDSLPRLPNKSSFIQTLNGDDHLLGKAMRETPTLHGTQYDTMVNEENGLRIPVSKGDKIAVGIEHGERFNHEDALSYNKSFDKDGEQWHLERGSPEEIEQALGVKKGDIYDYNAPRAIAYAKASLKYRIDRLKQLDRMKNDPALGLKAKFEKKPAGYREINFPGLQGYHAPKKVAEMFDDYSPRKPNQWLDAIEKVSRAITSSLFLVPVPHLLNVAVQAGQNIGWHALNPLRYPGSMRDFATAAKDVATLSPFFRELYKKGFLEALGPKNDILTRQMMKEFGDQWKKDPAGTGMAAFAKKVGLSPQQFYQAWLRQSSNALWHGTDVMGVWRVRRAMQDINKKAGRAAMDHRGIPDAIKSVAKDLPDYYVPPRIWQGPGGRAASQFLRFSPVNVFGRYHYNIAHSAAQIVRDTVSPNATMAERQAAVGKIAALTAMYMANQYASQLYEGVSGDDEHVLSPHGILSPIDTARQIIGGNQQGIGAALGAARIAGFEPSPLAGMATEVMTGQHYPFGGDIVQPGADTSRQAGQLADTVAGGIPALSIPEQMANDPSAIAAMTRLLAGTKTKDIDPDKLSKIRQSRFKPKHKVGTIESLITGDEIGRKR